MTGCIRPTLNKDQILKIKSDFTPSELEYFAELAFESDLHSKPIKLLKWSKDIKIGLTGGYTNEDSSEVSIIVNELNAIINTINVEITSIENSNLKIHFLNYSEFGRFHKYAPAGMHGFVNLKSYRRELISGIILINESLSGNDRKSTIREEISNALGLINDSYKYPTSVFQQFENKNISYDEIDKKIISLLYNYDLPPRLDGKYFKKCFFKK